MAASSSSRSTPRWRSAALSHYKLAAERFATTKAEIEQNTRFSAEGRKAELGDYCVRSLSELGRTDALLERAQAQLAELQAEARKVPLDLSPGQAAFLPDVYRRLAELDALMLAPVLEEAVAARDVVTLQAFMSGPTSASLRLAVSDADLERARDAASRPLPAEERKVLARMRELVAAAEGVRKGLVREMKQAAGLERDQLESLLGIELGKPKVDDDPIARTAAGEV